MHFQHLQAVGRGRVGVVYRSIDPDSGEPIAVKHVGSDGLVQLQRGFEVQRALDHPHVLRAHRIHLEASEGYTVLDLADGEIEGPLTPADLLTLTRDLASALHHVHSRGWIHRDVKPGNLLLRDRRVLLSDFGLAIPICTTGPIAPVGTPPYMPAECFLTWTSTPGMDWFALGVTVFELLTGVLPFQGVSLQDELLAKQRAHYSLGGIPAAFQPLIEGLLLPDQGSRWGYQELMRHLDGNHRAAA